MRWTLIAVFLPIMAVQSWAAKRMTVVQLEQVLDSERAAHKSDIEIARKISDVELSERLTEVELGQLSKQFAGGSQPAMALLLLADRSSFLDPPANELPATPAPDAATQKRLLEAAKRFAVETLPNLPNLLATRTTFSFDDNPRQVTKGGYPQHIGLHPIGSSKAEVSIRNKKESPSTRTGSASLPAQGGLMTWGEFGSALLIIVSDSAVGKIAWSHWENAAAGVVAVFHYEVPRKASHYEIDTPVEQVQRNIGSSRWAHSGGMAATITTAMVHNKPGYQGSLWVDPATGTIVRVTLVADLKGSSTIQRVAILVDYAPVPIADKTVICPVRSLAFASAPATVNTSIQGDATEWLNENLFTDYHLFASTSRILSVQSAAADLSAPAVTANAPDGQASPTAGEQSRPETSPTQPVPQQAAMPSVNLPSGVPTTVPVAKVETLDQNTATNEASSLSEQPQAAILATAPAPAPKTASQSQPTSPPPVPSFSEAKPQYSAPAIEVNVNRVLVPVVVRDKQGRTVADLKKENFQVFDEGKLRSISAFNLEKRRSIGGQPATAAESNEQSPVAVNTATQSSVLPERITVLLFDDLHLTYQDTTYVQKAASKALDGILSGSSMAGVVSTSGKTNSGLTRDRAKLQDAIMNLRPSTLYRSSSADCPNIDYYQADLIENKHDPTALQDAVMQVLICNPTKPAIAEELAVLAARRVVMAGQQDIHVTFSAIAEFVKRMANLPGQRTLILVSPGFLTITPEAFAAESHIVELAAQSNVSISALDARGVYTTELTASDDTRGRSGKSVADMTELRRSSMTRNESVMMELADGTGGTFFHNSNDLDAGFKTLTETPETLYMLELSIESVKPSSGYHSLRVKVNREGTQIQARRGYFMPEPEKSRK